MPSWLDFPGLQACGRVLSLEDAVRKMTGAVAERLIIRDRGLLREGMQADVVVFDAATIQEHSTFERPHQLSTGVEQVVTLWRKQHSRRGSSGAGAAVRPKSRANTITVARVPRENDALRA